MNLMVVDGDAGFLQSLEIGLLSRGHQAVTCRDASEAVENMRVCRRLGINVHLMLANWRLRGSTGINLVYAARAIQHDLPCILMFEHSSGYLMKRIAAAPHIGCIEKPFTPESLIRKIEVLVTGEDTGSEEHAPRNR